jgi:hypothetical protein
MSLYSHVNVYIDVLKLRMIVHSRHIFRSMSFWIFHSVVVFEYPQLDDLLHPLLRWLLITNKAHLRPLRADERFSG